mmetsp:Transcript_101/g.203  ORF Transcript_101/g.203 Transcript_101/m.203 type:complete len:208 (-) Transcript_101:239-862(-)|eukprot:CAMPEP_0201478062 /NCGR_PEP_ID=MMETSP0151_2-20130828/2983_1 /ASSEMBLY_ACC=CAM_ASM_000257 /TAXON_ID=200890 /ORGANISM="Paramoeba atlantica, Strain 621/1 / CCAP 1560/9" /LENGTH=207 /DNA_ID=CAMNT_0047859005 /DNA_START=85 /DNA_END=708 /DNA_ORIENTATION=+
MLGVQTSLISKNRDLPKKTKGGGAGLAGGLGDPSRRGAKSIDGNSRTALKNITNEKNSRSGPDGRDGAGRTAKKPRMKEPHLQSMSQQQPRLSLHQQHQQKQKNRNPKKRTVKSNLDETEIFGPPLSSSGIEPPISFDDDFLSSLGGLPDFSSSAIPSFDEETISFDRKFECEVNVFDESAPLQFDDIVLDDFTNTSFDLSNLDPQW